MSPSLSIVIPCYNMGEFLQETLDSVLSYPNPADYEVIIVNDGSNDQQTIELLKKLEEQGVHVLNQENQGLAKARNNGIKMAKGKYVLPLDADNKIRSTYISESIKLFEAHSSIDIIYGNKQHFDQDNRLIDVPEFNFPLLCEKNYIDACACFRKSHWEKMGGYDEQMPVMGYEDWDFWLRSALSGAKFHKIEEVVFDYRVRSNSMISDTNEKYDTILHYIYSKPQLRVVKTVAQVNKKASQYKHIKNAMEYKIGKILLGPIRFFQNKSN